MIKIPFNNFLEKVDYNLDTDVTDSVKLKISDNEEIDLKISNNTNKYILVLSNEDHLIYLFILNLNSMNKKDKDKDKDKQKISLNSDLGKSDLGKLISQIINSMNGISTHIIKYPEASISSGQVFSVIENSNYNELLIDSSQFNKKSIVYCKNSAEMAFSRPFTNEFEYNGSIISFLDIFNDLKSFPKFNAFCKNLFSDDELNLIIQNVNDILNSKIDVDYANTLLTLPINQEYINITPVCSAKILNEIQFFFNQEKEYSVPMAKILIGGANPQNASDYFSNIRGYQKVFISRIPSININNYSKLKKHLYKFDSNFSRILNSSYKYISEELKNNDPKVTEHVRFVLDAAFKDNLLTHEKSRLEKSFFLSKLIDESFLSIDELMNNIENVIIDFDIKTISNQATFYFLLNLYNKNKVKDFHPDIDPVFISKLQEYENSSYEYKQDLKNSLINDIALKIESDFNKILKIEEYYFNDDFENILKKLIQDKIFGVKI